MKRRPWTLYFDGSCQPRNPGGHATYGWVLLDADGDEVHSDCGHVCSGEGATNNVAEYAALLRGLEWAAGNKTARLQSLRLLGDSQLVVNTVAGKWRCKKPHLQRLLRQIQQLLFRREWTIGWIPREENSRADELSNKAYVTHCNKLGIPAIRFQRYSNRRSNG